MRHTALGRRSAAARAVARWPLTGRRRFGEPPGQYIVALNNSVADSEHPDRAEAAVAALLPRGPTHVKPRARYEFRSGTSVGGAHEH